MGAVLLMIVSPACLWVSADDIWLRVEVDQDLDGVTVDIDCDDLDPLVLGPTTWYNDGDGDGWGSPTDTETACRHSGSYVPDGQDCNDFQASINPGAQEIWYDGVDSDCDNGDDFDADRDDDRHEDYGGQDCDDQQPEINSVAEEICGDGWDNNCDGSAGDCGWYGDTDLSAQAVILGEGATDRLGIELLGIGDVDGDGLADFLVSAYRAEVPGAIDAGLVGLILRPVFGRSGLDSVAAARYLGVGPDDRTGRSMGLVGDVTGDGQPDLAIGAERYDLGTTRAGGVHLTPLVLEGDVDLATEAVTLLGEDWDQLGRAIAAPGDVNGDGEADLWLGAPGWNNMEGQGVAWLVHGPVKASMRVSDTEFWGLVGQEPEDNLGRRVAVADMDGDGVMDFLATAPGVQGGNGAMFMVAGPNTEDVHADDAIALVGQALALLGSAISLGDLDADGQIDLILGAPGGSNDGPASGIVAGFIGPILGDLDMSDAVVILSSDETGERFGGSVSAGYLDNDPALDLLIGSEGYLDTAGRAFMVLGPLSGAVDVTLDHARFSGAGDAARLGGSVAVLGDLDGDGFPELGFGAWGASDERGAAYILRGGPGI
jgi:hypothetical protein